MLKPRLKPSHNIWKNEAGDIQIGDIGGVSYRVKAPPQALVDLLLLLDGTRTLPRLVRDLQRKQPAVVQETVERILARLEDANLLEDGALGSQVLTMEERELYDRQIIHFSLFERSGAPGFRYQERLKEQRVVVLGLGGWGTWLSLNLALLGFGSITLVDGDFVEMSNLNRQVLYRHDDIGTPKVEAGKRTLLETNPHVEVETVQEFVRPDREQVARILDGATMVIEAWANMSHFVSGTAEQVIHEYAYEHRIPTIEIAGDPVDVAVGPVLLNDGSGPCNACLHAPMRDLWYGTVDAETAAFRREVSRLSAIRKVNAWQSAPSLSIIAGIAATEAVKVATGYEPASLLGKRFGLSLRTYESRLDVFEKSPGCSQCGKVAEAM